MEAERCNRWPEASSFVHVHVTRARARKDGRRVRCGNLDQEGAGADEVGELLALAGLQDGVDFAHRFHDGIAQALGGLYAIGGGGLGLGGVEGFPEIVGEADTARRLSTAACARSVFKSLRCARGRSPGSRRGRACRREAGGRRPPKAPPSSPPPRSRQSQTTRRRASRPSPSPRPCAAGRSAPPSRPSDHDGRTPRKHSRMHWILLCRGQ